MSNLQLIDNFKQFLVSQDLAPISVKGYIQDILYFNKWLDTIHQTDASLINVAISDLQAFRESLSKLKRQKPATLNRRVQVLKRFYQWCLQTKMMNHNPAETLHFIKHVAPRKPHALNQKDVHALLSAAGQSPHQLGKRNLAILHLFLQTGLRVGEVAQLQIRDVTLYARSGAVTVISGKGRKQREIPLNAAARSALSTYLATRTDPAPDHFLFISKRGTAIEIRTLQKMVHTLVQKAKITHMNVSAHTLRHTFATRYLMANPEGLLELSTLLGHESCQTTAIYTKASAEKLAHNIERLDINIYGEQ